MAPEPSPLLQHVQALTDGLSIVEHAKGAQPRRDLGYCSDDAGRALALVSRLDAPHAEELGLQYLAFLERAALDEGRFWLRGYADGTWRGESDDASARAILGVATASAGPRRELQRRAAELFDACGAFTSPFPRAMAYAALGACEVLRWRTDPAASRLVTYAHESLPRPVPGVGWPWPEPRLTYANALIPHALMAVGEVLGDTETESTGRWLLGWLVAEESFGDHFSFTPTGGADRETARPGFDQQPIEAWAMADACAYAFRRTRDPRWWRAATLATEWFLGANDRGVAMFDPTSGGGFDGLTDDGVNSNQGAESTLAYVASRMITDELERPVRVAPTPLARARGDRKRTRSPRPHNDRPLRT